MKKFYPVMDGKESSVCPSIDKSLMITPLPATVFIKNFVEGEKDCNYEKFLVEFLNSSIWFRGKVSYDTFTFVEKQDNGQCDVCAKDYELDFKLLASSTLCQAKRELSSSKYTMGKGITVTGLPRKKSSIQATNIYSAIRYLSLEELENHERDKYTYGTIEYDIQDFIKVIKKDKNLFLFFPYVFSTDEKYNFNYVIGLIRNAIKNDFSISMQLRLKHSQNKETYFSCIYSDFLIIFEYKNNDFIFIDCVNTQKSKTYIKLLDYS